MQNHSGWAQWKSTSCSHHSLSTVLLSCEKDPKIQAICILWFNHSLCLAHSPMYTVGKWAVTVYDIKQKMYCGPVDEVNPFYPQLSGQLTQQVRNPQRTIIMVSIASHMPRMKKQISKKSLYVCYNIYLGSLLTFSWTKKYEFKFIYPINIMNMPSKHISKLYARGQWGLLLS